MAVYRKCLIYSLQSGITSFWIEAYFNKEIMDALIFATLPFYDPPVIIKNYFFNAQNSNLPSPTFFVVEKANQLSLFSMLKYSSLYNTVHIYKRIENFSFENLQNFLATCKKQLLALLITLRIIRCLSTGLWVEIL